VSKEELRRLLVNAVPEAPAPTDRWATVAGRVQRRRRQRLAVTMAAAVVAVLAVGTGVTQAVRSTHHAPGVSPLPPAGGGPPTASPAPAPENKLAPPLTVPASPPPGVAFDPRKIPPGSPGSGARRVVRTGEMPTPSADGDGIFRTVCLYSHMNTDDPLTAPGKPGTTYLHMYWGNTGVDAGSTAASVAGTGNSTCRGGTVDRSAYWLPALIDTKTSAPLAPELVHVYFESGYTGVRPEQVQPMPAGLRMVAGDPGATARQEHAGWLCWQVDKQAAGTIPRSCPAGGWVALELYFPQCWNGRDLDSPDHHSHLAYATPGRGCPATHPVALPQISYHVLYPVSASTDTSGWRLASDTYPATVPGGYAVQGGWVNGWSADIVNTWIPGCVRISATCGSHMLGDGRVLQGDR
jgi:hypothetical protein